MPEVAITPLQGQAPQAKAQVNPSFQKKAKTQQPFHGQGQNAKTKPVHTTVGGVEESESAAGVVIDHSWTTMKAIRAPPCRALTLDQSPEKIANRLGYFSAAWSMIGADQ